MTNRRDFIRAVSYLSAAGVLAGPMPWLKDLNAQDPQKLVRIGIIGVGSRGKYLLNILQMIPNIDICAFCDNYEPNFKSAQKKIGGTARGYYDYKVMLEKEQLDGVVIAAPLFEHAHMTIKALNAGIHVFCEKAMAMTYEDCNAMVEAHVINDRILQIGHQRLFKLKYQHAVKEINDGVIGPVTQIRAFWHRNSDWRRKVPSPELERKINWRLYHEYSLGLMTELASHQIQVANWVLNERPAEVWGSGSINHWKDGREVYDNINLVYKYPGGTSLVYDSMTSNKKYGFEEQIMGHKGTYEMEAGLRFTESPEPVSGMKQLVNQIEHKMFDAIPFGGASWVPDDPSEDKGTEIVEDTIDESDGSIMQMEAFIANVRANRNEKWMTKQGFDASIATIMGHEAMMENKVVSWPEGLIL